MYAGNSLIRALDDLAESCQLESPSGCLLSIRRSICARLICAFGRYVTAPCLRSPESKVSLSGASKSDSDLFSAFNGGSLKIARRQTLVETSLPRLRADRDAEIAQSDAHSAQQTKQMESEPLLAVIANIITIAVAVVSCALFYLCLSRSKCICLYSYHTGYIVNTLIYI